jgi:glycerol-3-phosphate acyltransferase PlsY
MWGAVLQDVSTVKVSVQLSIRCLLLTSVSTCFGHHYARLHENKGPVTAFGVLFCFCWMLLVAVVGRCLEGNEHY